MSCSRRYPHSSGVEGFYQVQNDYPVFCDVMQKAGYYAAIRGKVSHSTPFQPYRWDIDHTINEDGSKEHQRRRVVWQEPRTWHYARKTGEQAVCDQHQHLSPHKPFWFNGDPHGVSKIYSPEEAPIPGFLFDDQSFGKNVVLHQFDVLTCAGAILDALNASGEKENTIVVFLSDMACRFLLQKPNSTTTVLGHHHYSLAECHPAGQWMTAKVSAIDFLPTFVTCSCTASRGVTGTSFEPLSR